LRQSKPPQAKLPCGKTRALWIPRTQERIHTPSAAMRPITTFYIGK
jgi:hypothetical protein